MVRPAESRDFGFAKHSWTVCFDDEPRFIDWNFEYNYTAADTLIAEAEGEPAAIMQCKPRKVNLNGTAAAAHYISGVATMPEFRRRGLVRKLFEYALPFMYKRGGCVSYLISAVGDMYKKFGYTTVGQRCVYKTDGVGAEIIRCGGEACAQLSDLYLNRAENCIMYEIRDKRTWDKLLTELLEISGGCILSSPSAYAMAYKSGDEYEVYEQCGSMPIRLEGLESAPIMARITNIEEFLSIFPEIFSADEVITVSDVLVPENNGSFRLIGGRAVRCDDEGRKYDISELCAEAFSGGEVLIETTV